MYNVSEMAGEKVKYINEVLLVYNVSNSLNYNNSWLNDKTVNTRVEINNYLHNLKKLDIFNLEKTNYKKNIINNKPIYISLTSIFDNQYILLKTLISIKNQTLKPNKCYIYLSENKYLLDKGFKNKKITNIDLNNFIKTNKNLFCLKWVDNIGPYRKLLPLLKNKWNNDCLIITIDDDTEYDKYLIENLINDYYKYNCVINYRGFTLNFKNINDITYENRKFENLNLYNFATGKGGILYHPIFFHKTNNLIFNNKIYNKYCKTGDDIWFTFVRICNNINCYISDKKYMINDNTINENALYYNYNKINNTNTKNIKNVINILIKLGYLDI
jgi:hypothetical protein